MNSDPSEPRHAIAVQATPLVEGCQGLLDLFSPDAFSAALQRTGFSVDEEVELVVEAIRNDPTVWGRLAGIRHLVTRGKEIALLSGMVRVMEGRFEQTGEHGEKRVLETKTTRLLKNESAKEISAVQEMVVSVEVRDENGGSEGGGQDGDQPEEATYTLEGGGVKHDRPQRSGRGLASVVETGGEDGSGAGSVFDDDGGADSVVPPDDAGKDGAR